MLQDIQHIIDQIPVRHNLVSHFIFLGIFQSFFLVVVIFLKSSKNNSSLRILALLLLIQAIITTDTYLCYTGLMKYTLLFNDASEPLVLLIGPFVYFFTYRTLNRTKIAFRKHVFHFIPAILYFLSQITYYLQPLSVKLNAYLDAYHHSLDFAKVPDHTSYPYHWIKDEFRWLILISFISYLILAIRIVFKSVYAYKKITPKNSPGNKYTFTRNTTLLFLMVFFIIFAVYWNFDDDAGDHYIVLFFTFIVFVTSFMMLSESRFFQNSWIADKYETIKTKRPQATLAQIKNFIEKEQYFLLETASLKDLSEKLDVNPNYISQIINAETGMNFNDFVNLYRIDLSKKRLTDTDYQHLTIEGIGNSVGFKSKSTFYNAFKKHTQLSPAAFIQLQKQNT